MLWHIIEVFNLIILILVLALVVVSGLRQALETQRAIEIFGQDDPGGWESLRDHRDMTADIYRELKLQKLQVADLQQHVNVIKQRLG